MRGRGSGPPSPEENWATSLPVSDPVGELPAVRAVARSHLAGYPDDTATDALLIVDSLISDAIQWGYRPREVRLRASLGVEGSRVESARGAVPRGHLARSCDA